jgi:hypothetical protein
VTFNLLDATGRRIRQIEQTGAKGVMISASIEQLDILPAGSYYLRYAEGMESGTFRIQK